MTPAASRVDEPLYPGTEVDAHPFLPDISVCPDPVLATKAGSPEALVVIAFVQGFGTQGVLASVCEMDDSAIFADTIDTIDTIDATC